MTMGEVNGTDPDRLNHVRTIYARSRTFSLSNPPMPWFGVDIGGTLSKIVYFEPNDHQFTPEGSVDAEKEMVLLIHKYLMSSTAYGETGERDKHLQADNIEINGRRGSLHFIRFPTDNMQSFLALAKIKGLASTSSTVCATGGGAHKFKDTVKEVSHIVVEELDLDLHIFDELESLILGIEFVIRTDPSECYYWDLDDEDDARQVPYKSPVAISDTSDAPTTSAYSCPPIPYPYLVVNVGSGVSILAVYAEDDFKRVGGTSIGGGLFHGLSCLLTGCETFEEALDLASKGDNKKVDKLVKDIYGGDYDRFGLQGDTVAASFGNMINPEQRANARPEDLARAALVTVTNNIGGIALLCARQEHVHNVLFVGNFLRVNPIANRRLAFAVNYWSKKTMKALFLRHEGYFGAVGCLQRLMNSSYQKRLAKMNGTEI